MLEKHSFSPNLNFYTRNGDLANGDIFGMQFLGNVIMTYPHESLKPGLVKYLAMAATGMSVHAIGKTVYLSPNTIKTHLGRVYKELGATNINHATRILFETEGFVADDIKKSPDIRFSEREVEVLDAMSHGKTMTAAGDELGISGNTVRNHLRHMTSRNDIMRIGTAGIVMLGFCRGELTSDVVMMPIPDFGDLSEALSHASWT